MGQAIYRVYRPIVFADLVGQEAVSLTIQNQYAAGHLAHAYLFSGPRGVGKTTTARLVAKLANCQNSTNNEPCNSCVSCQQIASGVSLDVYEIDAASNTDVEHVRENIIKSVRFAPNQLKKKVFIIDEVHMLSTSAFNALLKTLEEPPDHVLFVLATTEIHKVPATIVSRCQHFDFRRIPNDVLIKRLKEITRQEKMEIEEEVFHQIVKQSDGCARDAESLLGQILALGDKRVTLKEASLILPSTSGALVETFLGHLFEKNAKATVDCLNTFLEQGVDLKAFLDDALSSLRERLFDDETGFVRQVITSLLEARTNIRLEHLPQLPVELAIVELCEPFLSSKATHSKAEEMTHLSPRLEETDEQKDFIVQGVDSSTTVFDTIPVISLDEVREKWPEVFEQIRECNASLPLFMQSCEVCGVNGEHVELGFNYDLYVDTVNKDKNRTLIEGVLERVLGKRMKVKAVMKKSKTDETIKDLVAQFGGSVN